MNTRGDLVLRMVLIVGLALKAFADVVPRHTITRDGNHYAEYENIDLPQPKNNSE